MEQQTNSESLNALVHYAPVWGHLFVYVVTCLIAATVFYFDYRPVVVFVEYFSGAIIPKEYTFQEAVVLWALLLGAPVLFVLGFSAAMQIRISGVFPLLRKIVGRSDHAVPAWMPMLLFVISAGVGGYDLQRAAGAPYQFALYAQVGVVWALVTCLIVGVVLILFSIYLSIDSIRGSLLASYGLIWAWLLISLSFILSNSLPRPKNVRR